MRLLKTSFDAWCGTPPLPLEYRDPHVFACALKSYLRDLPEPLTTRALYDEWMTAARWGMPWILMLGIIKSSWFTLASVIHFIRGERKISRIINRHAECLQKCGRKQLQETTWNIIIIIIIYTISKSLRKYVSYVPGKHEVKDLQKTAILGTAHILRKVLM